MLANCQQQPEQPTNVDLSIYEDEQKVWQEMDPLHWQNSVTNDTIFKQLYTDSVKEIKQLVEEENYDVVLEVGCGTGEIIGFCDTLQVPRIGVDINPMFIQYCKNTYKQNKMEFQVADATKLNEWWVENSYNLKYQKPLILIMNNTIMIMPKEIRNISLQEMLKIAGENGKCLISFWNGNKFKEGIYGFYMKNEDLCGNFDPQTHCDFLSRTLLTPTGYSTHWLIPQEIKEWLSQNNLESKIMNNEQSKLNQINNIVYEIGFGIFAQVRNYQKVDIIKNKKDSY